jgi:hypothetical protein
VIKIFDLVGFHNIFQFTYNGPVRKPKLGHYLMVVGIVMILFIGFNRLWHFTYILLDAMVCGFFRLTRLPAASTFWHYVNSLGINQAKSFLKIIRILRDRVWRLCGFQFYKIHVSADTTVETLYGHQQGGRKKVLLRADGEFLISSSLPIKGAILLSILMSGTDLGSARISNITAAHTSQLDGVLSVDSLHADSKRIKTSFKAGGSMRAF